jgi:hypothetical protein
MQQSPPPMSKLACLGLTALIVLVFVFTGLLTLGLFSHRLPLNVSLVIQLAIFAALGTGFLFNGLKTWRSRLAKGQNVLWYMQPMILFALAQLFLIPGYVIYYITGFDFPNGLLFAILLITPSILLFLAAAFFGIQRLMGPFTD